VVASKKADPRRSQKRKDTFLEENNGYAGPAFGGTGDKMNVFPVFTDASRAGLEAGERRRRRISAAKPSSQAARRSLPARIAVILEHRNRWASSVGETQPTLERQGIRRGVSGKTESTF